MAHVVLWASQRSSPNICVAVCFREAAAVGPADDDEAIMEGSPEGLLLRNLAKVVVMESALEGCDQRD